MRTFQNEPGSRLKMNRAGPSNWLFCSRSIWIMRRQMRMPCTNSPMKNHLVKEPMPNRPTGAGCGKKESMPPSENEARNGRSSIMMMEKSIIIGGK